MFVGWIVAACLALVGVSADVKFIGTYDWAAVASLGENVTFPCVLSKNVSELALPENSEVVRDSERWQLPNSHELIGPWIDERIKVNGSKMTVQNVGMQDRGIYLCHVELQCMPSTNCSDPTEMWFKHGLNLNGPLYANLMDKYRMNFIIASASAGGTLLLFLVSCLIYKFRYKDPFKNDDDLDMPAYSQKAGTEDSRL